MIKKSYIKSAQTRMVRLLKFASHKPLYVLTRDNSQEIAKLLGYWIIEKFPLAKAYLVRGKISVSKFHVVLIIEEENEFWVLDPAIWQFFKYKHSMLVGQTSSVIEAMDLIKKTYGGVWNEYEKLNRKNIKVHEEELKQMIKRMSLEN